jgi:uncharacterized protein YdhG (YjbR/CyaY superfamily)
MKAIKANTVAEYIAVFPASTQKLLKDLRAIIKKAAPKAEESISYMMPAYKLHGPLVYFGGYDRHIGFYPTGSGIVPFEKELADYKRSKGAVQFPLDKPLPASLITKMVKYRVKENVVRAKLKAIKK